MTSGTLPLWEVEDLTPYSELNEKRMALYAVRGPTLLRRAMANLAKLEVCHRDCGALLILNDVSKDLGALNPAWFTFSVEVFKACLDPKESTVRRLRPALENTLKRLRKAA